MNNYENLKQLALEEMTNELANAIVTNVIAVNDTDASIIFHNGTATINYNWNEMNKNTLKNAIKDWLLREVESVQ